MADSASIGTPGGNSFPNLKLFPTSPLRICRPYRNTSFTAADDLLFVSSSSNSVGPTVVELPARGRAYPANNECDPDGPLFPAVTSLYSARRTKKHPARGTNLVRTSFIGRTGTRDDVVGLLRRGE